MSILPPCDASDLETFEHPLAARYASRAMVRLLSPMYRMKVWRRLWVALAESEAELGLPITPAQLEELRATQDAVDLDAIARFEASLRHDVMAAIYAWAHHPPGGHQLLRH